MKLQNINIRISEEEKKKIQEYCQKKGMSVSEFIRMVCMEKIGGNKIV